MKNVKKTPDVSRETFTIYFTNSLQNMPFKDVIDDEIINKFYNYYTLLLKWNHTHNLTRITDYQGFIEKHIFDSLLPYSFFNFNNFSNITDIGSGGGFPGVPLSIVFPDTSFTLIDKVRKKCSFLTFLSLSLSLKNVSVICSDISKLKKSFDLVTMRAVCVEQHFLDAVYNNILDVNGQILLYLSDNQHISSVYNHTVKAIPFLSYIRRFAILQ